MADDRYNGQIEVVKSVKKLEFFSKIGKYLVTFRCVLRLYLNDNGFPGEPGRYIFRSM
jgi:hypothetical protein